MPTVFREVLWIYRVCDAHCIQGGSMDLPCLWCPLYSGRFYSSTVFVMPTVFREVLWLYRVCDAHCIQGGSIALPCLWCPLYSVGIMNRTPTLTILGIHDVRVNRFDQELWAPWRWRRIGAETWRSGNNILNIFVHLCIFLVLIHFNLENARSKLQMKHKQAIMLFRYMNRISLIIYIKTNECTIDIVTAYTTTMYNYTSTCFDTFLSF
jgi:hypothetical protein